MSARPLRFESLEHRILLTAQTVAEVSAIGPQPVATAAVQGDAILTSDDIEVPEATSGPTGLTPAQLRQEYGVDQITLAGGTITGNGAGMTIAIVDAYDDPAMLDSTDPNFSTSDLAKFDAYFGLPNPPSFTKLNETGGTTLPGPDSTKSWEGEESLDVEYAHAIAPDANIILIEANSALTTDFDKAIQTAGALPGVNVVSMSFGGNETSTELSRDVSDFVTPATTGGVTFVAGAGDNSIAHYAGISPYVIGVGGTTLTSTTGVYGGETTWTGSGGSVSQFEPQPSYQSGIVSAYSTTMETLPDVAFDANPNSGVSVYNSYSNGASTPWSKVGGNSLGAPSWAALIAIVDQGRADSGLGSLSGYSQTLPMLYSLPASDFHDITSGVNYAGDSAGPGYDLATGLGSPIANLLVPDMVAMVDPAMAINGGGATFVRGGSSATVAPNLTLVDTHGTLVQSATVTIDNAQDPGDEEVFANTQGTNISESFSGDTLTLSGQDTVADYQQVLRSVVYLDNLSVANTTTRQITFAATDVDNFATQVTQSVAIDVSPEVVGAFVSGAAWNASYLSMLDSAGLGSTAAAGQGFELASGGNQLTTMVPWNNVNQISIAFSEPVTVSQNSLTLYNSANATIPSSGFSYNSAANIATWQFATPLAANKYVMNLAAGAVTDAAGAELDGDWTTSVSTFAAGSGNGSPGSDFNFYFDVLPGDANNSGSVTNGDVLVTKLQVGATSNSSNYLLDVNASGNITNGDVLVEKLQVGSNINSFSNPQLPPQSAPAAPPATLPSLDLASAALTTATPAGEAAVLVQSATAPVSQPAVADDTSSVMISPDSSAAGTPTAAAASLLLPIGALSSPIVTTAAVAVPLALPGDEGSASAVGSIAAIAPPAADALFQSLSEPAQAAPALQPGAALALVLNRLTQGAPLLASLPVVADADAPASQPAASVVGPAAQPARLVWDEDRFAKPVAPADEASAFDLALAAAPARHASGLSTHAGI